MNGDYCSQLITILRLTEEKTKKEKDNEGEEGSRGMGNMR